MGSFGGPDGRLPLLTTDISRSGRRVEGRFSSDPGFVSSVALYCNTCPCLQCAKRLVQVGVKEVVYSQAYGMDDATKMLLDEAGVKLRQFRWVGWRMSRNARSFL